MTLRLFFTVQLFFSLFQLIFLFPVSNNALGMISLKEEKELGERLFKEIKAQAAFIDDGEVISYVNSVGRKVLKLIPYPLYDYNFFVINDDGINAFAMPGGIVFIHSGLLEVIDSEDELVCVLSHEIAHVEARHIARRIERMKRVNIATAAAMIAGIFLGRGQAASAIMTASSALGATIGLKYSRDDEEDADRRAFSWICRAGYNPEGLITVLEKMQKMRWLGQNTIPGYLSTHPGAAQRITYIEDLIKSSHCASKFHRPSFTLKRIQVRLNVETKDPYMLIGRYKKAISIQSHGQFQIRERTLPQINSNDEFLLYGLFMAYLKAREYDDALKTINFLINAHPRTIYQKDLAMAYYAKGNYKKGASLLEKIVKQYPDDIDAKTTLARCMLELGQPQDAVRILKPLTHTMHQKDAVFLTLGQAYSAIKDEGMAHYYFYLYYQAIGRFEPANYHRNMAKRLLPELSPFKKQLVKQDAEGEKQKSAKVKRDEYNDKNGSKD